ncbi:hypothetical protein C5708_13765 [Caulobacter sp. CCUG 60055]|uniref:aspartyl protease family protein n=1 Tax=Caulobacter sp. CCUG 60055 TaxID=2100090 RepID=UPI001FA6B839|nr:aspartyl protease family protein [Caulobacter sp. CCUG 60055]MBQ1543545.1 retroviral-like aspartic protease family protein [Caulobacteraceae bacterium]MCI3181319.1 hypothetical protein [Caulobacter sp. CCUG 60055]
MSRSAYSRRRLLALLGAGIGWAGAALASPDPPTGSRIPLDPTSPDAVYEPPASLAAALDLYSRMTAPVLVNGAGPFPFVVDTGANQTVISTELADLLRLPLGPPQPLHGAVGVRMADTAQVDSLSIGARMHRSVMVSILPQAAVGGPGLLGVDRLGDQRLTLDFKGRRIRIEDSRGARRSGLDLVAPAARRAGQLTLVKARLGRAPMTVFLDSGAETTIGNMALRNLAATGFPKTQWSRTTIISATGQQMDGDWAVLPELKLGGLDVRNLLTIFADLHTFAIWNMLEEPALLLGVDVLSQFEFVSLDFARSEVRFRPPQGPDRVRLL